MRRPDRIRRIAAAAFAAVLLAPASPIAAADAPRTRLEEVERALDAGRSRSQQLDEEAARIEKELAELKQSLVDSARRAQQQEETVSEMESRLESYRAEERAKIASLEERRVAIHNTLAALQRISRTPPAALLAAPEDVADAVHTSVLLSAIVPGLTAQADELRSELAALRQIRSEIAQRRAGLDAAMRRLQSEQQALDRLIARKAQLRSRTLAESAEAKREIAALAESARDLKSLIDGLESRPPEPAERPIVLTPPGPVMSIVEAKGTLALPARGTITIRFGERNEVGVRSHGIVIETRPLAQVVAPYEGRIVYAGEFRRYGQLLIVDHGEGYHSLLAGIASIDGVVGQWLLAGEPVGRMGQPEGLKKPELYVELRRDGEPINPLPWLALTETKVSG